MPYGQVHRQPALADTLQLIGEMGRDGFYTGAVAQDIVSHLQSRGGLHTLDDFAGMRGEYVTPDQHGISRSHGLSVPAQRAGRDCADAAQHHERY